MARPRPLQRLPGIFNSRRLGVIAVYYRHSCDAMELRGVREEAYGKPSRGMANSRLAAWLRPKQTDLVPGKQQFRWRFPHPLRY